MKKGLFLCLLLSMAFITHAEQLKFVTVLSSPVGTFNKLEEVDPAKSVQSPVINFCTSIGQEGKVVLRGNTPPDITTLNLSEGTTLGGDGGNYILNSLTMKDGGTLKGSRLLANTVQINNPTVGKSTNLYTNELTVAGAKTETLDINNGESKIMEHHNATEMVWSNQYKMDNACGTDCAKQYLLKEKGSTALPDEPCQPRDPPRGEIYTEDCPPDQTGGPIKYTWNYSLCRYDKSGFCTQGRYTCVTSYQWKTVKISIDSPTPGGLSCSESSSWYTTEWATSMVCGSETEHMSGYKTWDNMKNCTPGQYYLYVDTYACRPPDARCSPSAYGYYCLKCGTVSSEADCVKKSDIKKMYGDCSANGGGGSPGLQPITPGDIVAP